MVGTPFSSGSIAEACWQMARMPKGYTDSRGRLDFVLASVGTFFFLFLASLCLGLGGACLYMAMSSGSVMLIIVGIISVIVGLTATVYSMYWVFCNAAERLNDLSWHPAFGILIFLPYVCFPFWVVLAAAPGRYRKFSRR